MVIYISTPEQLNNIRNDVYAHYQLTNDIDMSNWGNFEPIDTFYGQFNGNGYKINNLTINSDSNFVGLFTRVLDEGTVKNLGLQNVNIESSGYDVGGICGLLRGTIQNCFVTGQIKGNRAGGLVGRTSGTNSIIENCFTDCQVQGGNYIGGFVSSATSTKFYKNYSISTVSGNISVGGFYGAFNNASFVSNYFDYDRAGTTDYTTTGVFAKSTSQMQQQSTYSDWDFNDVWTINNDYPSLRVFDKPTPTQQITLEINSHLKVLNQSIQALKRKVIVNISSTNKIDSTVNKALKTAVQSIIEQITSSIDVIKNTSTKIITLDSNIKIIDSSVDIDKRVVKVLTNTIEPIQAFIEVIIPNDIDKPIYANVYAITNDTNTYTLQNPTNIYQIENPTRLEVM